MWGLTKAFIRVYQAVFFTVAKVMPFREPEKLLGAGSFKSLPGEMKKRSLDCPLIVTDKGLMKLGLLEPLFKGFEEQGVTYVLFDEVEPNPKTDDIERALRMYLDNGCRCLLAVGGGSSIDTAKAVGARIARPNKSFEQLGGFFKVLKRLPMLIAVPTTAGTGSEVTIASVVTDRETHHKYAINDLALTPRIAVLDPELTVGLPPSITAATGMDALTHAVESYIDRDPSRYCKECSEKAVGLVFENLEKVYRDGKDIQGRENMLHASYLAGIAFTRASLNFIHPIAHSLGGLYNIPHGLANAVVMPYVLDYFGAAVHKKLARLADAAKITKHGMSNESKATLFISEIRRMNRDMGIPDKFDCIKDVDVEQMITWVMKEAYPNYQSPVYLDRKDIRSIIESIRA